MDTSVGDQEISFTFQIDNRRFSHLYETEHCVQLLVDLCDLLLLFCSNFRGHYLLGTSCLTQKLACHNDIEAGIGLKDCSS